MTPAINTKPSAYPWTAEKFYRLIEKDFFAGERVELIEGELVIMPAQLNLHAAAIKLAERALERIFGEGYWVRVQNSLDLSPISVVDPDLAVILGNPEDISRANPTTALLVIEVSESTLDHDQGKKLSLYARSGIADYWIVNLIDNRLEVYRNPAADAEQVYGVGYANHTSLGQNDSVSPLAMPNASISVAKLFPKLGQ